MATTPATVAATEAAIDEFAKAVAPAAARQHNKPREYVVFARVGDEAEFSWIEVGRATAISKDAARDMVLDTLAEDEQDGTYTTVPVRYWQPQSPQPVERVVKRRWS